MDQKEINIGSLENFSLEQRARQLLQVWRDYYSEIFEVDLHTGSFDSLMEKEGGFWAKKGFVNIEVILVAEKYVYPEDKQAFREFFDLDKIAKLIKDGIYVSKLNFRLLDESGDYRWVKVKNIVPTKHMTDRIRFFSCFRLVDEETDKELRIRQELIDALENMKNGIAVKNDLFERMFRVIKTPLNGIIGMTQLAEGDGDDAARLTERIRKISDEARQLDRDMSIIREEEEETKMNVAQMETPGGYVNKITLSRKVEGEEAAENKKEEPAIPEDFVYISGNKRDSAGNGPAYDFTGKKILVVEDNELNIEVMRELLESSGASVDVAQDGKMAVIRFVSRPAGTYDAILMDIDIPILDGYSATRCIRISGKDDSRDIPIYAVTSNNFNEDVLKSLEYGFSAFFAKPVDFRMLFERLAGDL